MGSASKRKTPVMRPGFLLRSRVGGVTVSPGHKRTRSVAGRVVAVRSGAVSLLPLGDAGGVHYGLLVAFVVVDCAAMADAFSYLLAGVLQVFDVGCHGGTYGGLGDGGDVLGPVLIGILVRLRVELLPRPDVRTARAVGPRLTRRGVPVARRPVLALVLPRDLLRQRAHGVSWFSIQYGFHIASSLPA